MGGAPAARRPQIRDETDWSGLYDEGLRLELGGELTEGTVLVAPFTRERALLVVMVPLPIALLGTIRQTVERIAQLVHAGGGLLQLLSGRIER